MNRRFAHCVVLAWGMVAACFGDEPPAAKTDWTKFDPKKVVEAASAEPKTLKFERLWSSQERVRLLQGLAISADAKRVLACSSGGEPIVFDGNTGKVVALLPEKVPYGARAAALSFDGSHRGGAGRWRCVRVREHHGEAGATLCVGEDSKRATEGAGHRVQQR